MRSIFRRLKFTVYRSVFLVTNLPRSANEKRLKATFSLFVGVPEWAVAG